MVCYFEAGYLLVPFWWGSQTRTCRSTSCYMTIKELRPSLFCNNIYNYLFVFHKFQNFVPFWWFWFHWFENDFWSWFNYWYFIFTLILLIAVEILTISQMTNTIQKRFKISSTQLLYQSSPYQALTLFITGPFLDGLLTNLNVFSFKYTPQVLVNNKTRLFFITFYFLVHYGHESFLQVFILLSCLISVSVNFSTFLVIGKTSPITYQVLGHLKTCLVLAFGYVLLSDPFSWRNILGILIALFGMILYSYFCSMESQQKAIESSIQVSETRLGFIFSQIFDFYCTLGSLFFFSPIKLRPKFRHVTRTVYSILVCHAHNIALKI